jgi:hypothetical protein
MRNVPVSFAVVEAPSPSMLLGVVGIWSFIRPDEGVLRSCPPERCPPGADADAALEGKRSGSASLRGGADAGWEGPVSLSFAACSGWPVLRF